VSVAEYLSILVFGALLVAPEKPELAEQQINNANATKLLGFISASSINSIPRSALLITNLERALGGDQGRLVGQKPREPFLTASSIVRDGGRKSVKSPARCICIE